MRGRSLLIPGVAVLLVLLELAAYTLGGVAAIIASRLWVLHGLFFLGAAVVAILRLLLDELRSRRALFLVALVASGLLIFWPIRTVRHVSINREATQQVAAGLENLGRADLGYAGTAFLGYPSRQYLPLAVAPRVLGRTVPAMRLGAAVLLLLGLGVFAAGLRALQATPEAGDLAGVAMVSLFTFPGVARQLPFYDQTLLPFALTCHAAGFLALCLARFRPAYFLAGLWAVGMLGTCYTPGLAAWALFVALLASVALHRRRDRPSEARLWGAGAILTFGIGACAWITRLDVRRGLAITPAEALARAGRTLRILLFGDPVFFWSPILMLPILLVLVSSLTGRRGWAPFVVASWSLAAVLAATQMSGWALPSVEGSLHRGIVAIPLVVGLLVLRATPATTPVRAPSLVLWAAAIVLGGFAWHSVSGEWRKPTAREAFVADLEELRHSRQWGIDHPFVIGMFSAQGELEEIDTLALYFWPAARVVRSETDLRRDIAGGRGFVVYADRGYGLPPWVERIAAARTDIDLAGESWPLELVRATGSPADNAVETENGILQLERAAVTVGGRRVIVRNSSSDLGAAEDLFDGNPSTPLRTRAATTAIVDLQFETSIELRAVSVTTGTMSVGLRVLLYDNTARPRVFANTWTDAGPDPTVEIRFPTPQKGVRRVMLEISNMKGGDGHIHIREIRLQE
jgi:hypothetical protein